MTTNMMASQSGMFGNMKTMVTSMLSSFAMLYWASNFYSGLIIS